MVSAGIGIVGGAGLRIGIGLVVVNFGCRRCRQLAGAIINKVFVVKVSPNLGEI